MTDQELLERVEQGQLHVDAETLDVHIYHRLHRRFYKKKVQEHPESGRRRFKFQSADGTQHIVYRNRLVWIYFHRQLIPDTHFVDHVDGNNTNDHPSNLQLITKKESHQQGNSRQLGANEYNWKCFWDYVEFMGHAPPEGSVLWT